MATALFITRQDLVQDSIINGNVDTDKFIQFIKIAQQMHIQNYLGTRVYDKITEYIVNNNMPQDYQDVLSDYVKPMLINFAMVDYLPFAAYEVKNGGVFKHRAETSEVVGKEELDFLPKYAM